MTTREMGKAGYLMLVAVLAFLAICAALSSCAGKKPAAPANKLLHYLCDEPCSNEEIRGALLMADGYACVCLTNPARPSPTAFRGGI